MVVVSCGGLHALQSNLSIPDTLGPSKTVLIREVSLFQSVHNSRFDCIINFGHKLKLHSDGNSDVVIETSSASVAINYQ